MSQLLVQDSQTLGSPEPVEQDSQTVCGGTQNNQSMNETGIDDHSEEVIGGEHAEASPDIDQYRSSELKKKKMFSCSKCGKNFHKKRYAEEHCKIKAPWICPKCFAEITHAQNIKRHKCTNSTPKVPSSVSTDVKCDQCQKIFINKSNLRRHKLIVHKVWENNNVVCDEKTCPFTTKNIAQLRRHKTINHTRKRIFECNQCEQKFLSMSGLQKHVRSDHRFQCKNCLQTFSMEKQLRQHNRVVHNTAHDGIGSDEQAAVVVSRVIGEHATHKIYTGTQVSTDL